MGKLMRLEANALVTDNFTIKLFVVTVCEARHCLSEAVQRFWTACKDGIGPEQLVLEGGSV